MKYMVGFGGSGYPFLKFFYCIVVASEYLFVVYQMIYCLFACLLSRRRNTYSGVGVFCLKLFVYSICMLLYIYGRKRLKPIFLNSPVCWGMTMLSKALYWHHGQRLQFFKENYFVLEGEIINFSLIFRKRQLFWISAWRSQHEDESEELEFDTIDWKITI